MIISNQVILNEKNLVIIESSAKIQASDTIENGDFETGTNTSWTGNLTRPTIDYWYGVNDTNPHDGTYSYHINGLSDSRTGPLRGFIFELSQNITVSNPLEFNISGYVYVNQCYSAEYGAWACVFVEFFDSTDNRLGRINYRFASVYENRILPWISGSVIPLYNQLTTWLEFNRNISQDFVNEVGGDPLEITQIEFGFQVYADDGSQSGAGDVGYCEAFFDDWKMNVYSPPQPKDNYIENGDFETGTNTSWTGNLTRPTVDYWYGVNDTNPHDGTYSYHINGFSDSQTGPLRGFVFELSQNITVSNPHEFNISGYVYVNQCYSAEYGAWACVFVEFFNSTDNRLGRINYRFASVYENRILPWISGSVIPLYNQLTTWLEFNRNISQDFVTEVGGDPLEITQIEFGFQVYADDGSQSGAGDVGYCEAYYDDWKVMNDTTKPWSTFPNNKSVEINEASVTVNWTLYDDVAPGSYTVYQDGMPVSGPIDWDIGVEISIPVDTSAVGLWNYTIIFTDEIGLKNNHTVWITVYPYPPTIAGPPDFNIFFGDTGFSILWSVTGNYPAGYEVYRNVTELYGQDDTWSGSIIIWLTNLQVGKHNFTCIIANDYGFTAKDEVWITVLPATPDETPPFISRPDDIIFENGSIGYSIVWTGSDDRSPWWATVRKNDTTIIYDQGWIGNDIEIFLDGLPVGTYEYNCTFFDEVGNFNSSVVIVEVIPLVPDDTAPVITPPSSIEYEVETEGHYVLWECSDDHPYAYGIYINGTETQYRPWHGEDFNISVDGLPIGNWVVNLTVWDLSGYKASSTVTITVTPPVPDTTSPSISQPAELTIAENMPGSLSWEVNDENPYNYVILRNRSEIISSGEWMSGLFQYSFDSLPLGTWEFYLTIWDQAGHNSSSTAIVKVLPGSVFDNVAPQISQVPDQQITYGTTNNTIKFYLFDVNPKAYRISINNIQFLENWWNISNKQVIVSLDGLIIGFHVVKVTAWDIFNNTASRIVGVTITGDNTPPTISALSDLVTYEGTNISLTWVVYDEVPLRFEIISLPDGGINKSGSWSGEDIELDLFSLSVGEYTYRCIVYDASGNFAFDDVFVTILKTRATPGFELFYLTPMLMLLIIIQRNRIGNKRRLKK